MPRDDRENMKRGPYMRQDTYDVLKQMSDVTDENVRDTLDEIVMMFEVFAENEDIYDKLERVCENKDKTKAEFIAEMIDVSVNRNGNIIINPVNAKMD